MEVLSYFGTKMIFEMGAVGKIGSELANKGCKKALIVTDQTIKAIGLADKVAKNANDQGIMTVIYDGVLPDPTDIIVEEGAAIAREEKVDAIIGVGGGSSIDAAKGINALLNNPSPIGQYYLITGTATPNNPGAFLVEVPTTSGTGSEISVGCVITDTKRGSKAVVMAPATLANIAVIDPELMPGLPPKITAYTGVDALSHAVEAITCGRNDDLNNRRTGNVLGDMHGEKTIYLIMKYLKRAVENGSDMEARTNMHIAATLGMMSGTIASCHLGHGIAHSIGAVCHISHGFCCAYAMPASLEFVAAAVPEKVIMVARAMGINTEDNMSPEVLAKIAADKLRAFTDELGIPKMKDLILESQLEKIADVTMTDVMTGLSPRKATKEDVVKLLKAEYNR